MEARVGGRGVVARVGLFIFILDVFHHKINGSFYKPSNADFCFHSNLFSAALAIFVVFFIAHIVQIHLTVAAHVAGGVVSKYIQRVLAGVEAFLEKFGSGWFLVGLADFVLEITAFQVFVKAFIHFHECFPPA